MSLEYYHKPLILTYSGGKDSDVLLQLAIECLKSNEFEVLNSHTTVDAPETVYYIRDKFKELADMGIKATVKYPHDKDGNYLSMWSLIVKKEVPPTRFMRYCCKELKETSTPNRFVATGVREAESQGRKGRDVFATRGLRKSEAYYYYYSHVKEVFEDDKGYLRVPLYKNKKRKWFKVHRLVANAFIPNPYNKPQVNHKDGNKQNNSFTNLEWVTDEENKEHQKKMNEGIL